MLVTTLKHPSLYNYYAKLSFIQKLFFPSALKNALEDANATDKSIFNALFQTNSLFSRKPFFSYINQFYVENQELIAKTVLDSAQSEIDFLQQYYQTLPWFRKLLIPTTLRIALKTYPFQPNPDKLQTLYETLAKHTQHWFLPKLSLFDLSPRLKVVRELDDVNNKLLLFTSLTKHAKPLQQLTCICQAAQTIPINTLLLLKDNLSELTIDALLTMDTNKNKPNKVAKALSKLPSKLALDGRYVNAVVNNKNTKLAANMLTSFNNNQLLTTDNDTKRCLTCLQEADLPMLQLNWFRLKHNAYSTDEKKELIQYASYLFNDKTHDLWEAVPKEQLHELHQKALYICKQTPDHEIIVNKIIRKLLQQEVVFNDKKVQDNSFYDLFTQKKIDRIIAFGFKSCNAEQIKTILPHLIRRNDPMINQLIANNHWLSDNKTPLSDLSFFEPKKSKKTVPQAAHQSNCRL